MVGNNPYDTLKSAARYVKLFRDKVFVVKLGGEVLESPPLRRALAEQLAVLSAFSIRVVIVHGGGSELDAACRAMDIPIEKKAGRRVTTPKVLEAAKMVFAGPVHIDLLADLRAAGLPCVGLTGVDAGLVHAHKRPPVAVQVDGRTELADFGLVGDIDMVDPRIVTHLLEGDYVPVIAPLAGSDTGAIYNTNADTIAAAVAAALNAEKLIFVLKVGGLLEDASDPSSLVPHCDLARLAELEKMGRLKDGMLPKAKAVRDALSRGVKSVHLVSGMLPDSILVETFTNEGCGTMIERSPAVAPSQAASA
jgi:acetylglutamate kinase